MAKLILSLSSGRTAQTLAREFQRPTSVKYPVLNAIMNFVVGMVSGTETGRIVAVSVDDNATPATGTIVFSAAGAASDTVLVNGATFTAVASGATGNQWNVGASATLSVANLATAINASATALVSGQVSASAATGTLTISSLFRGVYGNAVTIAKGVDAGTVMTVSGARLLGGAADTAAITYTF